MIPLVLAILQRVVSQSDDLLCTDNLSCINPLRPDDPNDCLNRGQLCDDIMDCASGIDEGIEFASLDCKCTAFTCMQLHVYTNWRSFLL